jgi:hypothetical protein
MRLTIYERLLRALAAGHLGELVRSEKPGTPKGSKCSGQSDAQPAGREARPATPGAGVLPDFQSIPINSNQFQSLFKKL